MRRLAKDFRGTAIAAVVVLIAMGLMGLVAAWVENRLGGNGKWAMVLAAGLLAGIACLVGERYGRSVH